MGGMKRREKTSEKEVEGRAREIVLLPTYVVHAMRFTTLQARDSQYRKKKEDP